MTLGFQNWYEELGELSLKHTKIAKFVLWGDLFVQSLIIQLENFRGILSHDTERWCKILRKTTRGLKNDIRNLVNFHASRWKFDNLHFDGFLFLNAYKILDEKVQKSYLSWHWWVMASLKKNWLLVPEMTWRIW